MILTRQDLWKLATAALAFLFLAGCQIGADYTPPDVSKYLDEDFASPSLSNMEMLDGKRQPMINWWRQFEDVTLSSLIERLVDSNLQLAEARERIIEARARRGIVDADHFPRLDGAGSYMLLGAGEEAVSLQPRAGEEMDIFSAGVVAGWELDLWGRVSKLVEAADADIAASHASYHDLKVSLAAELTLAYIDARILQARLDVFRRNISLQEKTLELAESRLESGIGNELEVSRTNRLLQTTRARVPALTAGLTAAENRINILLGLPARQKILEPGSPPAVPALIGIGIPADLLVRRSDIRLAQYRYREAMALAGSAEADKYVRLSLSGAVTIQTDTAGDLLESLVYSLGPNLHIPLFNAGRIQSNIAVRKSRAEQALFALEQKIVQALSEVENAAVGVVESQQQVRELEEAEKAAKKSVELADSLYHNGLSDFFQVLDSEKQLVSIQDSLLLAKRDALSEVVRLYRALGGGWETGG